MCTSLALINAAGNGQLQEVCDLLQEGANINQADDNGNTAIICASLNGHTDIVVELLKHEMLDVNHQCNDGYTALMWASDIGHPDVVVELLKHDKVDLNLQDKDGLTALAWANIRGHAGIARCLEEHVLKHPLIIAAKYGKLQEVCDLLQEGANINEADKDGNTAIIWATLNGHTDIVVELLKHEMLNVNHQNNDGDTALMWASNIGRFKVVVELLKHDKVDLNLHDNDGLTAMAWASIRGHADIARCLEGHVLNQPLIIAAKYGELQEVRDLLQEGANINEADKDGNTAIIWATLNGHTDIVVELLKHEMLDVNHKNNDGDTALLWASRIDHSDVVLELLKHDKVDVNLHDKGGLTALLWSSIRGNSVIVDELLKLDKVDVKHRDNKGFTARTWAGIRGHCDIAMCLEEHAALNQPLIIAATEDKLEEVCDQMQKGANINDADNDGDC